ncbi:MAG: SAM hydroxide adenosyltransferase, partial [Acidimicrobiales bacterium]
DVFAPAAAHLCNGVPLHELGPAVDPVSLLPGLMPLPRDDDGTLVAQVIWVDRFGNCQLNVDPDEIEHLGARVQLRWGDDVRVAERAVTYQGIAPGQVGLVIDSYGMLSVCLGRRSAADELSLHVGMEIALVQPGADEASAPVDSQPVTLTPRSTS